MLVEAEAKPTLTGFHNRVICNHRKKIMLAVFVQQQSDHAAKGLLWNLILQVWVEKQPEN